MRFILTILFTLIAFVAFSQEGDPLNNAVKHNYKTSEWGTQWGVLKKPAGTGKHPTIIFFHGVGEAGSGSRLLPRMNVGHQSNDSYNNYHLHFYPCRRICLWP